jgi:hypothetical protein
MGLIINGTKMGKPYINGIKHNAYIGGQKIWNAEPPFHTDGFYFTVKDEGYFEISLGGLNGGQSSYQPYNWIINWGDGNIQTASGKGAHNASIPHTYTDGKDTHQIIIKPNGTETQGWFNAFGFYSSVGSTAFKVISIESQITEIMRTMAPYSHSNMLYNCSNLTSVPAKFLPATTLDNSCYYYLFYMCRKLTSLPENFLPATTLAQYSYSYMFYGCSGLTDIGSIDADWFKGKLLQNQMFFQCTAIQTPITYAQIPASWK